MRFEEKNLFSYTSFILRFGVVAFVILSVFGYMIKPVSYSVYYALTRYSVFLLIITPIMRVIMLAFSFKMLEEKEYFVYSILVFIIVVSGVII